MPRDTSPWWREPESFRETLHECLLDLRLRRKMPADEPLRIELPAYDKGVGMDDERRRRMAERAARTGD